MATYAELFGLIATESALKNKVKVALIIAAKAICDEIDTTPNHDKRKVLALEILNNTDSVTQKAFPILVAGYQTQTIPAIQGATDVAVQSAVNSSIDFLAGV